MLDQRLDFGSGNDQFNGTSQSLLDGSPGRGLYFFEFQVGRSVELPVSKVGIFSCVHGI